jgi:hypothetical protein
MMANEKRLKGDNWYLEQNISMSLKKSDAVMNSNILSLTERIKRLREKECMEEYARTVNCLFFLDDELP